MGGAEAVEEVDEGDAAFDGGKVGDGAKVHDFLDAAASEQGAAGGSGAHDVLVVTEDVEGVGGKSSGADVKYAWQEFAGDFVHVGDHEEESLGGGVGGGEGSGLEGSVEGSGGAAFGLHFYDSDRLSKDVFSALGGPVVDDFSHGGRGGDGVDGCDFGEGIGYPRGCAVSVHGFHFLHVFSLLCCFFTIFMQIYNNTGRRQPAWRQDNLPRPMIIGSAIL